MMRKKIIIAISLAVCVLIGIAVLVFYRPIPLIQDAKQAGIFIYVNDRYNDADYRLEQNQTSFLTVYGNYNYLQGENNWIQLAVVTTGTVNLNTQPTSFTINTPGISAENINISRSLSTEHYTLWYLTFDIIIDSDDRVEDHVIMDSITFNGIEHNDFGSIYFQIMQEESDFDSRLSLLSHDAATFGVGLGDYHATFVNNTNEPLYLSDVKIPEYESAQSVFAVMDQPEMAPSTVTERGATLLPEQYVDLTINFEAYSLSEADVFYISPIVYYRQNDIEFQMPLFLFTCGLQMSKDELLEIGNRLQ